MEKSHKLELEKDIESEESIYRWLADFYRQIQKLRISMNNRIWQVNNRNDLTNTSASIKRQELHDDLFAMEKALSKMMSQAIVDHPIWDYWLKDVRGVGPILATQLVGLIDDISKSPTISSLWKYAGQGVDQEGKADRKKKGEKLCYNFRLKVLMWNIGESFIKSNSPYKKIYDKAKERYVRIHPDWTKDHIHKCSMRKMNKIFLSHVWLIWREVEDLPTSQPYVIASEEGECKMHTHFISPWDMIEKKDEKART